MRCGVFVNVVISVIFLLNFTVGPHFGSVHTGCAVVCTYCKLLTLFAAEVNSGATCPYAFCFCCPSEIHFGQTAKRNKCQIICGRMGAAAMTTKNSK